MKVFRKKDRYHFHTQTVLAEEALLGVLATERVQGSAWKSTGRPSNTPVPWQLTTVTPASRDITASSRY